MPFLPAIQDRFILPLVIGPAQRESVLRPDHERGPVAAGLGECLVQRVQLRGRHADVDRAFRHRQQVRAGVAQELVEFAAQIVVGDLAASCAVLVLRNRRCTADRRRPCRPSRRPGPSPPRPSAWRRRTAAGARPAPRRRPSTVIAVSCVSGTASSSVSPTLRLFRVAEQVLEFLVGEADQVEIEAVLLERLQFDAQHLLVPSGVERQPVVGEHQRAPLRFGVRWSRTMTGTSVIPSFRAAAKRAWPAMITPSAPTRIGFVHPNSMMLAATCATCSSRVRARVAGVRDQFLNWPLLHLEVGLHKLRKPSGGSRRTVPARGVECAGRLAHGDCQPAQAGHHVRWRLR